MTTNEFLSTEYASAFSDPFRGQIYEYAASIDLQSGYGVKGRFNIESIPHLREVFEVIKDPSVRQVTIVAAVQTGKSLTPDIVVPYWMEHDPGDILWLLETDIKAKEYADKRAMPLLKSITGIAKMIESIDRDDATKTSILAPSCSLTIGGLNEGNVQTFSYRYVICDEAWMSHANGMLRQAIYRTRQYRDTCKVLLLGQGGIMDEDFHKIHCESDQRELEWACPKCGYRQPFELARLRGDDFHHVGLRGTYSGLSWEKNDDTFKDGRWDFEAVGKTAHIRCYDCDHRINDTTEERMALARTYGYRRTNPGAPITNVGFTWPALASVRIPMSDQVTKYLRAKVAKEELSYVLPMIEFYQKDLGKFWSDDMAQDYRKVAREGYDHNAEWPEEKFRVLIVDCQRDLAKFYHSVFAIALSGECRELSRGTLDSFDAIAEKQKEFKVKDQRVFLDCGYEMTRVLRECSARGHVGTIKVGGVAKKIWLCWIGLKGSGQETFAHTKKAGGKDFRIYSEMKFYNVDVGTSRKGTRAPWYEWSNLHCKDLLRARRDQDEGVPKMLTLSDPLPETDLASHFCQMRSEQRKEEFSAGRKRAVWVQKKETRPNHYWDIGAMLMAFLAIAGIIGGDREEEPG